MDRRRDDLLPIPEPAQLSDRITEQFWKVYLWCFAHFDWHRDEYVATVGNVVVSLARAMNQRKTKEGREALSALRAAADRALEAMPSPTEPPGPAPAWWDGTPAEWEDMHRWLVLPDALPTAKPFRSRREFDLALQARVAALLQRSHGIEIDELAGRLAVMLGQAPFRLDASGPRRSRGTFNSLGGRIRRALLDGIYAGRIATQEVWERAIISPATLTNVIVKLALRAANVEKRHVRAHEERARKRKRTR